MDGGRRRLDRNALFPGRRVLAPPLEIDGALRKVNVMMTSGMPPQGLLQTADARPRLGRRDAHQFADITKGRLVEGAARQGREAKADAHKMRNVEPADGPGQMDAAPRRFAGDGGLIASCALSYGQAEMRRRCFAP